MGKLPFTQGQFAEQFPPGAPLQEVFTALLGDVGNRFEDAGLPADQMAVQIVPCHCVEMLFDQLTVIKSDIDDPEDKSNYELTAKTLADHAMKMYCPY